MQKILKITVLLSISLSAYSQNFEVGSYVKDGKKIEGYIKYYDWIKSPKSIEFKANLESPEVEINAENIEGFSVHGEDFLAKAVSISLSPNKPKSYDKPYIYTVEDGFYFLQIWLKKPEINLYEMIDSKKESHFFVEKEGKMEELFYTKYVTIKNNNYYFQEKKGYIGQLRVLMSDCEKIAISDELIYTKNSLLQLCNKYLICKGVEIQVEKNITKDRPSFSIGFTAGQTFNGDEHFNWVSSLVGRMNFPRHFRNAYVQLELNRYNVYDNRFFPNIGGGFLNGFGGSIFAGSHFGNKNVRPFANLGMTFLPTPEFISNGTIVLLSYQIFPAPRDLLTLGVGISWKRSFKIEYRDNYSGLLRQVNLGYLYNF
jgi:hypothetical protein